MSGRLAAVRGCEDLNREAVSSQVTAGTSCKWRASGQRGPLRSTVEVIWTSSEHNLRTRRAGPPVSNACANISAAPSWDCSRASCCSRCSPVSTCWRVGSEGLARPSVRHVQRPLPPGCRDERPARHFGVDGSARRGRLPASAPGQVLVVYLVRGEGAVVDAHVVDGTVRR
jgi:hypothetical protein